MTRSRTRLIIALPVVLLVAAGTTWWLTREEVPQPTRADEVVTAAAKSGDFASVKRAVDAGEIKREDLRDAVRAEFERQTLERVNGFFDTTDAKAKRAILDRAIDDLEKYRAEARKHRPAAATQPRFDPANDPRWAMAAWALSQPPGTRARLAEFRVAIEKRRTERGLPGLFDGNASLPLGRN